MRTCATLLIASLVLAPLAAQKVGTKAPQLKWTKTFGFDDVLAEKLSQLRGSLVMLEFMGTYSRESRSRIPALTELHAKYAGRGLMVIGLYQEPEDDISKFVKKREIKFPVAIAARNDFQPRRIPYTYLVDKDGKVAWRGDPSNITNAQLEKLMVGTKPATVREGLEVVHQMRFGDQNGEAYKLAQKLLERDELSEEAQEQAKKWMAEDEKFVAEAMAAADAAAKEKKKDIYLLWSKLEPVANEYAGVPGGEKAKERLDALMKSKKNQQEVDAGQRWDEAQRLESLHDYDGAIAIYKDLGRKRGRTKAGKNSKLRERELLKKGMLGYRHDCTYCKAGEAACPTHHRKK